MSSQDVRLLEAEVEALRATVGALQIRIELLESERRPGGYSAEVAEVERGFPRFELPTSERLRSSWSRGSTESLGSFSRVSQEVDSEDRAARVLLAKEIGSFLSRALAGDHRGASGRDRLRLQNSIYIVCADHWGQKFNPPLALHRFAEVKSRCKVGPDCGKAVFVGFPSLWEARIAVSEARLELPAEIAHADLP